MFNVDKDVLVLVCDNIITRDEVKRKFIKELVVSKMMDQKTGIIFKTPMYKTPDDALTMLEQQPHIEDHFWKVLGFNVEEMYNLIHGIDLAHRIIDACAIVDEPMVGLTLKEASFISKRMGTVVDEHRED